jgi:hypothetical protein
MSATEVELITIPNATVSAVAARGSEFKGRTSTRHNTTDVSETEDGNNLLMMGEDEAVGLHPVDRGKHAYLFLAAAFVVEALIWGMLFDFSSLFQQVFFFFVTAVKK